MNLAELGLNLVSFYKISPIQNSRTYFALNSRNELVLSSKPSTVQFSSADKGRFFIKLDGYQICRTKSKVQRCRGNEKASEGKFFVEKERLGYRIRWGSTSMVKSIFRNKCLKASGRDVKMSECNQRARDNIWNIEAIGTSKSLSRSTQRPKTSLRGLKSGVRRPLQKTGESSARSTSTEGNRNQRRVIPQSSTINGSKSKIYRKRRSGDESSAGNSSSMAGPRTAEDVIRIVTAPDEGSQESSAKNSSSSMRNKRNLSKAKFFSVSDGQPISSNRDSSSETLSQKPLRGKNTQTISNPPGLTDSKCKSKSNNCGIAINNGMISPSGDSLQNEKFKNTSLEIDGGGSHPNPVIVSINAYGSNIRPVSNNN